MSGSSFSPLLLCMFILSLTDIICRTSGHFGHIIFADDLCIFSISLNCTRCWDLGEKVMSLVLKSDDLLNMLESQAFLEAVYSLYIYFNPAWLTTLNINVGHSDIYSLSFRLLVNWLQEHNNTVPTWNFSPPRYFLLHWSVKASEILTVFINIPHSAMYWHILL